MKLAAAPGRARRGGYLLLAGACLTTAALWHFTVGARVAYRIARDWKSETRYIGSQTNADPATGTIPDENVLGFYERRIGVLSDSGWPRSVVLSDEYRVVEHGTQKVLFEYVTRDTVDPRTGVRIGRHAGDFAVFPRNVQRQTYLLSSSYLEHIPVSFERTEQVDDIDTYLFAYNGPAEYTKAYLGSREYPGVPVTPGQEIRCADDKFYYRVWVEPITGEIAQLEEGCPSGDYIVDTATGKRLGAVDRWDGRSEGNADITRAVRAERARVLWSSRYFPLSLLAVTGIAVAAAFRPRVREELA